MGKTMLSVGVGRRMRGRVAAQRAGRVSGGVEGPEQDGFDGRRQRERHISHPGRSMLARMMQEGTDDGGVQRRSSPWRANEGGELRYAPLIQSCWEFR